MAGLKGVLDEIKHIGPIADSMTEWDGTVGDALELTSADRENIREKHRGKLNLQKREALLIWKQKKGDQATFENLIKAFESVDYKQYADTVRRLCRESGGDGSKQPSSNPSGTAVASGDSKSDEPPVPTLKQAFKILLPLSDRWKNIGLLLDLENESIRKIDTECRGVPDDCLREMLSLWLKQIDPRPTRKTLVEAVETYDPKLAQKINAL